MGFLGFGRPNVEMLDAKGNIEGLVRAAKYKKDPAVAEQARAALERRLEFFVTSLDNKNIRHVVLSREAIKLIGEPSVVMLSDVLEKGDLGRRSDAAFALGEVGRPSGVPALKKALKDPEPQVRLLAVRALARIDDPAVPKLVESALRDRDETVRYQASKALQKIEGRRR